MRTTKLTLTLKMEAVEFLEQCENIRKTARKFKGRPCRIRKWPENYLKIKEDQEKNPRKLTVHSGTSVENPNLAESSYDWVMENRFSDLSTSTTDIIDKAVSLDPNFKNGNEITLRNLVYQFLKRNNLAICTRTRISQIKAAEMEPLRLKFSRRVMTTYKNHINNPMFLINLDETAVYLNYPLIRTVHAKSEKTISVNIHGVSLRVTVAVSIAINGTKLPLFVIFKGKAGGSAEKSLSSICPKGIVACAQQNA